MSQPPDISPIIDRRPIATRERRFAQAIAHRMARAGINPNSISVSGMLFGIAAGAALSFADASSLSGRLLFFLGALLIQLRLLANLFDGMVAIERGVASPVGELYNEVPDRVSAPFILIGFGYAAASNPVLGYWAAVLALFTAYVRAEGRVAGAPQQFCGPMAKQHRMALVTIAAVYMALAPLGWQPAWGAQEWGIPAFVLLVIVIGSAVTAVRRLVRSARALRRGA